MDIDIVMGNSIANNGAIYPGKSATENKECEQYKTEAVESVVRLWAVRPSEVGESLKMCKFCCVLPADMPPL
jgi:hypothetical protein